MSPLPDISKKFDEEHRKNSVAPNRPDLSPERRSFPRRRRTIFSLILVSCMLIVALIMGFGLWWSRWDAQRSPENVPEEQPLPADSAVPFDQRLQNRD